MKNIFTLCKQCGTKSGLGHCFPYVPQCSPLLDHNLGYMDALCAPLDPCKRGLGLPFKLSVFGLHSGWCEGVVWWKNHCGFLIFFCNTKLNPQYLLLTRPGMTHMPDQLQSVQTGFLLKVPLAGPGLPPCLQTLLSKCISVKFI